MNIRYSILSFALLSLFLVSCVATDTEELGGCDLPESLDSYELVWSDEFEGTELDSTKWSYDLGNGCDRGENLCGWGNNELQWYTNERRNVQVRDSFLTIRTFKFQRLNQPDSFTSGRIVSKFKGDWTYCRVDVRAKIPTGQGIWSAIWMLPTDNVYGIWPKSGEIDIMENIGSEPNRILGTIHYGHDFWRFNSQYYELDSGNFIDDYHIYSVIWTDECIQFYVDGDKIGGPNTRSTTLPTTWPFDQRFHMILNTAVGGNLPGDPDASTRFPQSFDIDYVRVYQLKQ